LEQRRRSRVATGQDDIRPSAANSAAWARHKLPAVYVERSFVAGGGLILLKKPDAQLFTLSCGDAGVAQTSVLDFATRTGWNAGQGKRVLSRRPQSDLHGYQPRAEMPPISWLMTSIKLVFVQHASFRSEQRHIARSKLALALE
jgi:hypothetical protein